MLKTKNKSELSTPLLSSNERTKLLVKQSKCRAMERLLLDVEFNANALSDTEKTDLFNVCFTGVTDEEITEVMN